MIKEKQFLSWDEFLKSAFRSEVFVARSSDAREEDESILSERLLFTQSNARLLLGHDSFGRMHFVSLPTVDYPIPTCKTDPGAAITAHPGMFYQTDMVLFLGKLCYSVVLDDGEELPIVNDDSFTYYADHFLPVTRTCTNGLEINVLSFAPVADNCDCAPLSPLPLPGPAGAFHVLHLKNTGNTVKKGKVRLNFEDAIITQYEHSDHQLEKQVKKPEIVSNERGILTLWRPNGSIGIHLYGGKWVESPEGCKAEIEFCIDPGEEATFDTRVVLGMDIYSIRPEMSRLYMHTSLEWLNMTADFWRSRLGRLSVDAYDASKEARISLEIHIRNIIDNFNCLQCDAHGNLKVHWQGAPSHCCGRLWGIDVEPTAVSIMHVMPELGKRVLLYFIDKNRPPISQYREHSTPILVAPVILTRKWLEYTGDVSIFNQEPELLNSLGCIIKELMDIKHKDIDLFPSRYSSDGLVMRRYDHGTNVKVWYAFDSYAYILARIGREAGASQYRVMCRRIADAIKDNMVVDGPFGPQISGGVNLGENDGFYIKDDILYYDGEDSGSALAPVYGVYDFTYEPWINYHRFGRSIWCSNFDPEQDVLRWFPWGGPIDGTAYISQLGGSVARKDMVEAFNNMLERDIDVTGSAFWWPLGVNSIRRVTRCSQGQGAWVWQYLQQWLGIHVDGCSNVLTVAPRGLPTTIGWKDMVLGNFIFDMHWSEHSDKSVLRIKNKNNTQWIVKAGFRAFGAGADGEIVWKEREVDPGGELVLEYNHDKSPLLPETVNIPVKEAKAFSGEDSIVFNHFGINLPGVEMGRKDIFLLRFIVENAMDEEWKDVKVRLVCPNGWYTEQKLPLYWVLPTNLKEEGAEACFGCLQPGKRLVAPFWVKVPDGIDGSKARFDGYPFAYGEKRKSFDLLLPTGIPISCSNLNLEAKLTAVTTSGKAISKAISIPIKIIDELEYENRATAYFGI